MKLIFSISIICCILLAGCKKNQTQEGWSISAKGNGISIKAGILERQLQLKKGSATTSSLLVNGTNTIRESIPEIAVTLWKASPNEEPQGIGYSDHAGVEQKDAVKNQTDALNVEKGKGQSLQTVKWIDPAEVTGEQATVFDSLSYSVSSPKKDKTRLVIALVSSANTEWKGLSAEINYEIYTGFPVIRKWINIRNHGTEWLKISGLIIDKFQSLPQYSTATLLTPNSRGIDPSIVAFSDTVASSGIILANEIPSKLRMLSGKGTMGYNPELFEWVIGPGESFESEPVFMYAFSGEKYQTVSAVSTALDRCVENEFHNFLNKYILLPAKEENIAPVFCSWTNYGANINDSNMQVAAGIASRIGFKCFQLDAGWSDAGPDGGWAVSTPRPIAGKFPDMKDLSSYIQSKNMKTGLWYSDFINEQQAGKNGKEPPLFSLPLIRRAGGLGLSLCYNPSREKYVDEIVSLHKTFQADYFKQDLSNICYGDIAAGHESRTLKESYLRGLRGLFAIEDEIHREAPEIWLQLSHEIYWETPGPEADIAVLKHVDSYHSAPNEYWGAGNRQQPVNSTWKYNVDSLQQKLRQGAFRARDLWYRHRGLPLSRIEVFGAVTTDYKGDLSPDIIDRQICSWLMGAPISFSGDLTSLTEENIARYHSRFAMLEELQQKYNIYQNFQFSGVPAPTDEGWHWWGKLNQDGCGAVVVMRGNAGNNIQPINIPWVKAGKKYKLKGLFSGINPGEFSGKQLQNGDLKLTLSTYGQEIIEIENE